MPDIERTDRRQLAVLWPKGETDDRGRSQIGDPVELVVRWVEGQKVMVDAQGNNVSVDATAVVDRDVAAGSLMWQGSLEDWVGTGSFIDDGEPTIMEVAAFDKASDVKHRHFRRTVGLKRYKGRLPERD